MAARTRLTVGAVVLGIGLLGAMTAAPQTAAAEPDTLEAAKAEVEQLQQESSALDQDALEAQDKLDKARSSLQSRESDEAGQQAKVEQMKVQLRQFALAQYQDRAFDPSTRILFSADGDSFISRFATVQHVADSQNGLLQDYQAEEASLAAMKRNSEADVATIAEQERKVSELRKQSGDKLAEAEAVVARLTAEERQRLAEEERQTQQRDTTSDTEDSDSDANPDETSESDGAGGSPAGAPNGSRVEKVLATAKAQLGKPYVYAGNGPDAFDCSGFTTYAFKAAGVSLPRVSRDQAKVGTRVSRSELQPGDLVFYYSPISHVAIYLGDGKIIDSPRPGKTVRINAVDSMPFNTATRML